MPVRSRPEDDLMNMNTSKKQEGYVVIVVAALLAALTGFLALAVDIGVLYSARTSAQEVADAAALAGAFTFSPYYPDSPQPQTASNHALRVALNNSVLGQPITAADVNVNVNVANRRVTVDVQSTQNTYFARALGLQTENIAVEGVAEAAEFSTGTSCAKPWFIPNTVLSSRDPCSACGANEVVISGGEVSAFTRSKIGQQFSFPLDNALRNRITLLVGLQLFGEVLERLNRPVSKTGVGVTPPWVRIPPSPLSNDTG